MTSQNQIAEDSFSSDADLTDGELSESSSDIDAKLEEENVFDEEFLKCYSALKKRDQKIYDENVRFFTERDESSDSDGCRGRIEASNESDKTHNPSEGEPSKTLLKKKSNAPKMTLLDHQLALNEDEIEEPDSKRSLIVDLNQPVSKSFYDKELEEIKKSIEKVSEDVQSDDDDDELLTVKGSSSSGGKAKPSRRINSILDKLEEDDDIDHLKKVWSNPENLSEEDRFLSDYILNKRYLASKKDDESEEDEHEGFFSKNLDELPENDVSIPETSKSKKLLPVHHSDERNFDQLVRIPRNSTKTIRDLVEKNEKKEKRQKKLQKAKKKRVGKDADFEDMIGDIPTRFHYRETEPNDYGLSAEELLMATDEELDKWAELKKIIAHKTPGEELSEKQRYEARRNDIDLKKSIFKSIYGDPAEIQSALDAAGETSNKKQSKTMKRKATDDATTMLEHSTEKVEESNRKKKKRKRGVNHKKLARVGVAPDRLLAYGLSKTKLKRSKLL